MDSYLSLINLCSLKSSLYLEYLTTTGSRLLGHLYIMLFGDLALELDILYLYYNVTLSLIPFIKYSYLKLYLHIMAEQTIVIEKTDMINLMMNYLLDLVISEWLLFSSYHDVTNATDWYLVLLECVCILLKEIILPKFLYISKK